MGSRAPIDADAVRAAVGQRWPSVTVVDETPSTNADLLADQRAIDRTARAAELQTAGRGRLDRQWTSPRGAGLTFSVLVRPSPPLMTWGWLPLLAGVALRDAVAESTGVAAALKWPNDLLAAEGDHAGRKLAGVLAQTAADAAVIGIGLNVSTTPDELPVPTATSLALCGADEIDRSQLLIAILRHVDRRLAQWTDVDGDAAACGLAAAYREACVTLGREVVVTTGDSVVRGQALDIDDSGRLIVSANGERAVVGAGDVEHVRGA